MQVDQQCRDDLSSVFKFLEGNAVLHIVYISIYFLAATFLNLNRAAYDHSMDGIWLPFIEIVRTI